MGAGESEPWGLREAGSGEEFLHDVLVHTGGGAEDAGADVGDVGEFEEALDSPVLTEGAVEDGKDDVYSKGGGCGGSDLEIRGC